MPTAAVTRFLHCQQQPRSRVSATFFLVPSGLQHSSSAPWTVQHCRVAFPGGGYAEFLPPGENAALQSRSAAATVRYLLYSLPVKHRRRIKTEEKAKVVASVWGKNLFNCCHASYFAYDDLNYRVYMWNKGHKDDLKAKDEFILFFKIVIGKTASAARNWIHPTPPHTAATTFPFASVFILFL